MKRALSLTAIILVIVAILGCEKPEPQAPTLIEPEDGATLYMPPTFIWSLSQEAEEYVIHIWTDSTDIIKETLTDTTYIMPDSLFSPFLGSTCTWAVASKAGSKEEWSESWSFMIDKLDLDTTYFPFGQRYEWCYERHQWDHSNYSSWDAYDTFTITVVDSTLRNDSLIFQLEGGRSEFLGSSVEIWDGKYLEIWQFYWKSDTVDIFNPQPESLYYEYDLTEYESFQLGYNSDSLFFIRIEGHGSGTDIWEEKRIKKLELVYQSKRQDYASPWIQAGTEDSLIRFTTSEGQVYP